jgi:hypothetical protein
LSSDDVLNDSIVITSVGESSRKTRRDWIILLSVGVVLAVALRFVRIGHREFFGDEFLTLTLLAGKGPQQFLEGALDGASSIYHVLLRPWAALVGTGSEGLLRLPSAFIGLAACIVFFIFSRRYLRGTARAVCLLIFAMNPILVATSNEASPYALLTLFVVFAHFFAIRSLDKGGLPNWAGYALSVIGGVLAHPIFLFVLPAHFLFALLRGKRTPRAFTVVSIVGLIGLVALAFSAVFYAKAIFPDQLSVQRPSSSELAKGLVSVVLGNFQRYEGTTPNDFVRGIMYVFVFVCIALSVQYYRKRTAEAMAMPDNVVWIDETQDVVGRWKRLSLRAFLLFQWFGFVVPLLGLFFLGGFVQGFRLEPEMLLIILPALAVLMAMGIDAAPKEGALALGLLLILAMVYYDVQVLKDTGYGVKPALKVVRDKEFNPSRDLLLYTEPNNIWRGIALYRGDIPVTQIRGFNNRKEFDARQAQVAALAPKYARIFVIYHNDRRKLGRTEARSPLREWFRDSKDNGFTEVEEWTDLSEAEGTEMHLYKHLAPGEQPED